MLSTYWTKIFLPSQGAVFTYLLYLFLFSPCHLALAEWVIAEGSAPVEAGDTVSAKKMALHDAERNAIERAIGTILSSESIVENFTLIRDRILTKVEGYVQDLKILSEICTKELCTVHIKANVEKIDLADDLAAIARILPKMNYPTIGVLLTSQGFDTRLRKVEIDLKSAQQTIVNYLKKKGFLILDINTLKGEARRQANLLEAEGKLKQAAVEEAGGVVQILIKGEASLEDSGPSPYNERIHAYTAIINANAIETSTGTILASYTSEASVPSHSFISGGNMALKKAAQKLAQEISTGIAQVWLNECYNPHNIILIIEDISFSKAKEVISALLHKVTGVSNALQRSFLRNRAEIVVEWPNCNVMRFADKLGNLTSNNWMLEVKSVEGNNVRVSFKSIKRKRPEDQS